MSGKNTDIPLWFRRWQQKFYRSSEWKKVRRKVILREKGRSCVTGKVIEPPDIMVVDHIVKITPENYLDKNITLNPDNCQLMTLKEHNRETFSEGCETDFEIDKNRDINLF